MQRTEQEDTETCEYVVRSRWHIARNFGMGLWVAFSIFVSWLALSDNASRREFNSVGGIAFVILVPFAAGMVCPIDFWFWRRRCEWRLSTWGVEVRRDGHLVCRKRWDELRKPRARGVAIDLHSVVRGNGGWGDTMYFATNNDVREMQQRWVAANIDAGKPDGRADSRQGGSKS